MLKNYDESVEINHNPSWPYLPILVELLVVHNPQKLMPYWTEKNINNPILIKFIYMSKIHLNQSINYLLIEEKNVGIEDLKNPKALIG